MIIRLRPVRVLVEESGVLRLRLGDDTGSALALALAFLAFFGIVLAVVLSFADTGFKTTTAVRGQRMVTYALDAAIDGAINNIQGDAAVGRELSQPGAKPCSNFSFGSTQTVNGLNVTVTCEPISGSGELHSTTNIPNKAIVSLSTNSQNGPGVVDNGSDGLTIFGDVISNSKIEVSNPTEGMNVTGVVIAPSCSTHPPEGNLSASEGKFCNFDGLPAVDPLYEPESSSVTSPGVISPSSCSASTRVVTLSPGLYSSANDLNKLMKGSGPGSCPAGTVFWFLPGVFYFNFTDGDGGWSIADATARILGGTPTETVVPPLAVTNIVSPLIPFPGGCKTDTDPAPNDGVQFIFGGKSHLDVGDSKFEICARPSSTPSDQQIAIYGVSRSIGGLSSASGCVVVPVKQAQNCPLLLADNPNGSIFIHGTIYAPLGFIDLRLASPGVKEFFDRGLICQVVHLKINPSVGFEGSPISVPREHPPPPSFFGPRSVLFTAFVDGRKLRARADYVDDPSAGTDVIVKSWNYF